MPLDEYDNDHNHTYNRVINVYSNDNIDDIISNFLKSVKDENNNKLKLTLKTLMTNLRNTLENLENRYICSISGRVSYYTTIHSTTTEIGYNLKWFIVNVWRRSSILTILE